ncbi:Neuron navigator 2 [Folsomia candida]|uniref:Neuron navigator 2 n=1 Tax=Folsomia candida TaxID=158441 RepID=A0A226EQ41_FOLCA|nr:Neuron navigator 2 [Folsomia candida]
MFATLSELPSKVKQPIKTGIISGPSEYPSTTEEIGIFRLMCILPRVEPSTLKADRIRSCRELWPRPVHNAHVVAAFEQSLSNMTQRIQSLTCSAEQKVRRKVKYID